MPPSGGRDQQEVRHMPANPAARLRPQQERLGRDRRHTKIEVGQQQVGKLQAALLDDVAA
jgi:hypothetical protein